MKKGKKREITLKQLQKRKEIANKITIRLLILMLIVVFGEVFAEVAFVIIKGYTFNEYKFIPILLITILFFVIILCIVDIIEKNIKQQIKEKQAKEKISKIKKMAQGGNLKGIITPIIKNNKELATIVSKDIEDVVYKGVDVTNLIIDIYLKKHFIVLTLRIPIEMFLDKEKIELILEHYIDTIKIENTQQEEMKVEISGEGLCYKNDKVTDSDLLKMFDLKEDE